ncbi:zinc ribbon domain-containing protein [Enorma phocaeensis]|uniref:Zinc ribbon domain-containing protein n=1 Tax=Enorma phocaeensis TaxID=1871019 RepID=A0A921ITZ8_9ACTN|nr:zinc ribbon domain-containing protein [Enorma phocaeensis]HJG37078.1 zinc ribbon domain-containing protein [Enorma phocaeensis]
MECRNCSKHIADNATFCPYCGTPTGTVRPEDPPCDDARGQRGVKPPHRGLPLPVLIGGGAMIVIAALVLVLFGFNSIGRSSAPLPEPFEGTVEIVIEDMIYSSFSVQDGQSTWTLENPLSEGLPLEISAGLNLVAQESGSGVYEYDLKDMTWGGASASAEEAISALGLSSANNLLLQSQAQIIIPAGAGEGDIVGTWGVRYESGGLPTTVPNQPDSRSSVITELTLDVKQDGTFSLTVAYEVADDGDTTVSEGSGMRGESWQDHIEQQEESYLEQTGVVENALVFVGTWYGEDAQDLTFQPETSYQIVDGTSSEPEPVSHVIPPVYAGLTLPTSAADSSDSATDSGDAGQMVQEAPGFLDPEAMAEAAFVANAREGLWVPDDPAITYAIYEPSYWEGTGTWVTLIEFYEDGELVASAYCADDGTPVRSMYAYSGDRG